MKSAHKVERFDYSKYESKESWDSPFLYDYQFWGIHPIDGRIKIDTKRYKKIMNKFGIKEFMPDGLFKERNTVYFEPIKIHRYDYKINIFRDLLSNLKEDWIREYKPIFKLIKSPKDIYNSVRLNSLSYISSSDDLDNVEEEAMFASIKREKKYVEVQNSLYAQYIIKIESEIDRITLRVMTSLGYKGTDFDVKTFREFSDGLRKKTDKFKFNQLNKYHAWNFLHKMSNFLKHNSKESYKTLQRLYPTKVCSKETKTADKEYENGMYAVNWIRIDPGYIDRVFAKLNSFFTDYCRNYLKENVDEADWNYDDYFKDAFQSVKRPDSYFGV